MCHIKLQLLEAEIVSPTPNAAVIIYEYDGEACMRFEHDEVFRQLYEAFAGVRVGSEDLLLEDAKRVEAILVDKGAGDNILIRSLYKKAKHLGPAIPFRIFTEQGEDIKGSVRRFDLNFRYSRSTSAEMRKKIRNFLESFGTGEIEERECAE